MLVLRYIQTVNMCVLEVREHGSSSRLRLGFRPKEHNFLFLGSLGKEDEYKGKLAQHSSNCLL